MRVRSPVVDGKVDTPHQPPSGVKPFANDDGIVTLATSCERFMSTRTPFFSAANVAGNARESRRSSVTFLPPGRPQLGAAPVAAAVCCVVDSSRTVTPI